MRVSAAIGRGCCYAEWSKLPDALRVRKVHIGLQIRQSWPAVPVSDSRMKRKARSDTEVARKRAAARQVPNPPGIDYREHPELYKVARGEQGVLTVEPYKSEILPHWRFREPDVAEKSAAKIYELYEAYKKDNDFVGMDMARKFLQMGYTRAMRYANHKGGRKYDKTTHEILPKDVDTLKLESAQKFKPIWKQVEDEAEYQEAKKQHLLLEKAQKLAAN